VSSEAEVEIDDASGTLLRLDIERDD